MAIYWLLSGRIRFEHSLSWGLVGNALYHFFVVVVMHIQWGRLRRPQT